MSKRPTLTGIAFALAIIVVALLLKYGVRLHLVSGDMATRGIQVLIGLVLAAYGNVMPKNLPKLRNGETGARKQMLLRLGGWLFTVAGFGYAAIWAAVPINLAADWAMVPVAAATAIVAGYTLWVAAVCQQAGRDRGPDAVS